MISLRRQIDQLRAGGSTAGMSLRAQLQSSALDSERSASADGREDHPDIKRIMRKTSSQLEARIASRGAADRSVNSEIRRWRCNCRRSSMRPLLPIGRIAGTRHGGVTYQAFGAGRSAPVRRQRWKRRYQSVTRDLASARAKYEELLKRQMDAEVNEAAIAGGTIEKFRVSSSPTTPREPAKPAPRLANLHRRPWC